MRTASMSVIKFVVSHFVCVCSYWYNLVQDLYVTSSLVTIRDVPNIRFVFASVPNSGPNSLYVFGRIASS